MNVNLKNRQQTLAIFAAAVVALFAADRLVLTPAVASWKQRSHRIAEMKKQVAEGRSLVQRQDSLRARWDQMRTNTLPVQRPVAEDQVLKAFDRWAQASRVTILSINPQWKQQGDEYATLECRVEASGGLGPVSRFLYEVERDPLALKLEGLELTRRDNEGQQFALGLQISGLVLLENQPSQNR